jgi:ribonuclease HI
MGVQEFQRWQLLQRSYILFFDGASKGDPRVAGAGGILLDPKGNLETSFARGLGKATNNQIEACALYQCILLAKEARTKSLIAIGDSNIIINLMVSKSTPFDNNMASITARIQKEIGNLHKVSCYQVS